MTPRLLPEEPLPPYSHVPGRTPHPLSDPAGHGFGKARPSSLCPDPHNPGGCWAFLRGIDLFHCGYYWEAHEAWEAAWLACGRHGTSADFLKGLIQLGVAGVEVCEGKTEGVVMHARRS